MIKSVYIVSPRTSCFTVATQSAGAWPHDCLLFHQLRRHLSMLQQMVYTFSLVWLVSSSVGTLIPVCHELVGSATQLELHQHVCWQIAVCSPHVSAYGLSHFAGLIHGAWPEVAIKVCMILFSPAQIGSSLSAGTLRDSCLHSMLLQMPWTISLAWFAVALHLR